MEQHPVPQNVTTFQFRLIGDMTIKQFGYLAGGAILAYISYKLPLPFFFTWPMTITFGFGGFCLAFVPIEERPMDIWVMSFLKNVYSPTLFHWEYAAPKKEPALPLSPRVQPKPVLTAPTNIAPAEMLPVPQMASTAKPVHSPLEQLFSPKTTVSPAILKPAAIKPSSHSPDIMDQFFLWIDSLFSLKKPATIMSDRGSSPLLVSQITPRASMPMSRPGNNQPFGGTANPAPPPTPKQEEPKNPDEIRKKEKQTSDELTVTKLQLEALQKELGEKTMVESRLVELQKQFSELMTQRLKTEKELISLRQQAQMGQMAPGFKPASFVQRPGTDPTIKTMRSDVAIRAGLPKLTTFPNIITGIVKDYDSALLPGVLVTVKDKEGIPLRALKTNKLGQFAASTQLPNGTYLIEVEDPRNRFTFDKVQITLNGSVISALLIIAKSKRQLDRETLQKQIFGAPNANN